MKLLLENGHIPKNKRYTSAIVEDDTNKKLYFYDAYGAWVMWYINPSVTNNNTTQVVGTDSQTISLNGRVLSITGGNSIDLSSILPASAPVPTLGLNGTSLSLSTGSSVDLSAITSSNVPALSVQEVSSNYTVLNTDDIVIATAGNVTIQLQDASTARVRAIRIANKSTSNIYFKANGSQTVDGINNSVIIPDQSLTIVPKSSKWYIV